MEGLVEGIVDGLTEMPSGEALLCPGLHSKASLGARSILFDASGVASSVEEDERHRWHLHQQLTSASDDRSHSQERVRFTRCARRRLRLRLRLCLTLRLSALGFPLLTRRL